MCCVPGKLKVGLGSVALAAFVLAASVLPFVRSANYGLVNCDDYAYAATYAHVTGGVSVSNIIVGVTFTKEGIWMPLTWLSYMLDYELTEALGGSLDIGSDDVYHVMHAHSVALHGLNAVLLFMLLVLLAGRRDVLLAALAAVFWAAHPLRCESVAWIASRKDVLSMTGLLVALVCWVKWRRVAAKGGISSWSWYALSILAFCVGATAKPSVMCYPALVMILDWFFLKRGVADPAGLLRMCRAYVLPSMLGLVLGYHAYLMQSVGGCMNEYQNMPFVMRILNAAVSFGIYLIRTVVPTDLAPQCIMRWPHPPRMMAPGLAVGGLFCWWLGRHCQTECRRLRAMLEKDSDNAAGVAEDVLPAVAGGLWYAISILPFLGISGFGYHALADRFTYIPAIGGSIALLAVLRRGRKTVGTLALAVVVTGFAFLTDRQTCVWRDDEAMWSQTIAVDGDANGVATAGLGLWYYEHGHDLKKANEYFGKAFSANPDFMQKTCFVFADSLAEAGEMDKAYEVMKWTGEFSRSMRQAEIAQMGGTEFDFAPSEIKPVIHNRLARVACFMRDPQFRKAGMEELDGLIKDNPKSIHVAYLEARGALIEGRVADAEEAWERLCANVGRGECVRYRFLADELTRAKGTAK